MSTNEKKYNFASLETYESLVKAQAELTWEEIKEVFSEHIYRPLAEGEDSEQAKKSGELFAPVEFVPGSKKKKENVLRISLGVLDCDDISKEEFDSVRSKLFPYNYICYTTWKHTKNKEQQGRYRVRFIFPFTRPVGVKLWDKAWQKLNTFFGIKVDENCKDPSRGYYLPAAMTLSDHWIKTNTGIDFDIEKLLSTSDAEIKGGRVTSDDLSALAKKLARRKSEHAYEMSEVLKLASSGEPFGTHGQRDNLLYKIGREIKDAFKDFEPEQVVDLFHKSFEAMQDLGSRKATRDNFLKKLIKAKADAETEQQEQQEAQDEALRERIRRHYGWDAGRDYPYTSEEISRFSEDQNCSPEALTKRLIVYIGRDYYVFADGNYCGPLEHQEALNAIPVLLAPAKSLGVDSYRIDAKGNPVAKSMQELIKDYGARADEVVDSLATQKSTYNDVEKRLVRAVTPFRVTEACYDDEVHTFLCKLGGSGADSLLDFLSVYPLLSLPSSALYLFGKGEIGKSLLMAGGSRLISEDGPTPLGLALSDFNEPISRNPFVIADENMPDNFTDLATLRNFIVQERRMINPKGKQARPLLGCIRLIIAANRKDLLSTDSVSSEIELQATNERITCINCDRPEEVRAYLKELGPENVRTFVTKDRIAKHILWLSENHVIPPERRGRFLVGEGNESFHRNSYVTQRANAKIFLWLAKYLISTGNPHQANNSLRNEIFIKNNAVHLTARVLVDHWSMFGEENKKPTSGEVGTVLKSICVEGKAKSIYFNGSSSKRWEINTELLFAWIEADGSDYLSKEEAIVLLSKDTLSIKEQLEKGTTRK